eukprot:gene16849-65857_t
MPYKKTGDSVLTTVKGYFQDVKWCVACPSKKMVSNARSPYRKEDEPVQKYLRHYLLLEVQVLRAMWNKKHKSSPHYQIGLTKWYEVKG